MSLVSTTTRSEKKAPANSPVVSSARSKVGRVTLRQLMLVWFAASILLSGFLVFSMNVEHAPAKVLFVPGETTHGHYQIELACNVCHTPLMGVKQDSCLSCHDDELKEINDTHAAKKFNDPTNAEQLSVLNAKECITCHREHVPDKTHRMGLSLPPDYCFHCHQDIKEQRPSHVEFTFASCATSGCHNYHDNSALYENFLAEHWGEPDLLEEPKTLLRNRVKRFPRRNRTQMDIFV